LPRRGMNLVLPGTDDRHFPVTKDRQDPAVSAVSCATVAHQLAGYSIRATGSPGYLANTCTLEYGQPTFADASPNTTKLYVWASHQSTLDEVGRIVI
jgi:hypothetical protein